MRFDDFTGGLYLPEESAPATEQPTFAIPPNALRQADNVDFLTSGGVRGRRGSAIVTDSPTGELRIIRRFVLRDRPGSVVTRVGGNPAYDFEDAITGETWQLVGGGRFSGRARISLSSGDLSHYLVRRGPGAFAPVPPDATVTGLVARIQLIREDRVGLSIRSYRVHLVNADGLIPGQSTNGRGLGGSPPGFTADQAHRETVEYGADDDTWDIGLTPALVNDPDFGVGFSVSAPTPGGGIMQVVSFEIEIFYTVPDTGLTVLGSVTGAFIDYELLDVGTGLRTAITGGQLPAPVIRPHAVIWPQKQRLYFFDGANAPRYYDGDTLQTLVAGDDSELPVPRGPYVTLHKSRLFATKPGEQQFSVYASEPDRDNQWFADAHLSVNDEAGGHLTGLVSRGEELLIFKDTSVWSFVGSIVAAGQLRKFSDVGCVAPDTIQNTPDGVIYLGRDGLKMTDGVNVIDLSVPIRSLFTGRTAETIYTNAVGQWFPRRGQYWLKLTPATDPGYILHRVASAEGIRWAWSLIPTLPMNCAEVFQLGSDDGDLYTGDLDGNVWERDVGLEDNEEAIATLVRTHDRILDPKFRRAGRANILRPFFRSQGTVELGLTYDSHLTEQLTFTAGEALAAVEYQEPRLFVADLTEFGRFVAVRASSSESAAFELHWIDLDIRMRGQRRWP